MKRNAAGTLMAVGLGLWGCAAIAVANGCGGGGGNGDTTTPDVTTVPPGDGTGDETPPGNDVTPPAGEQDAGMPADAGPLPPPADAGPTPPPADAGPTPPAGDAGATATGDPRAAWTALVRRGHARFNAVCDTCHPGGDEDIGPRIIGKNFSIDRMRAQIRNGSGRMRPIPTSRVPEADMDALFAYLSTIHAVRGVERPQ